MATIPRLSEAQYNKPAYNKIWDKAVATNKIFMVILDKTKYSEIEWDLEPARPRLTLTDKASDNIIKMYDEYVTASKMDRKHYKYAGGRRNLIMTVKKGDAEAFANKLYGFLEKNAKKLSAVNSNLSVLKFENDTKFIHSETAEMFIPAGGAHVRQVEIEIPRCKLNADGSPMVNVTATVYGLDNPGTMFCIWNIATVDVDNVTVIKVSAQNTNIGQKVQFTYVCSIIAVGTYY